MSNPPSRRAILSLYHSTLRTSKSFSSYNFRNYFIRRTKDTFRTIQSESDPARIQSQYSEAQWKIRSLRWPELTVELVEADKLLPADNLLSCTGVSSHASSRSSLLEISTEDC
ncbi:complex 1 protein (lyr family) protein [Lentinula edodes]|uniref:Complex 1 protein (Lyr family) protein n=1 Tax=Lentinula edodes TaxID=5353 RepID=A0A1Q3DZR1_LENED|nr:complex 1 protein (lyr family) protein [Lentinula edodes]